MELRELLARSYRAFPTPRWLFPCFNRASSSRIRGMRCNISCTGTRYYKRLLQILTRHPDPKHEWPSDAQCLYNRYKPIRVNSGLAPLKVQSARGVVHRLFSVACYKSDAEVERLCEQGHLDRALDIMLSMDKEGTTPSVKMYRCLLKSCTKRKALAQARKVYAHLSRHKLESTMYLGESVVKTLVKCGSLADAVDVFNRLLQRTVVSWTAVISGYANAGKGQEALKMYQRMQKEGVNPNTYTFIGLLKACGTLADLEEGKRIHAEVLKHGCDADLFVSTCLVDMYAKCGSVMDAQIIFERLSQRDVVSWNSMLAAYVQQGQAEKVLQLYDRMQKEVVNTDARTFVSVLQACGMLAETAHSTDGQSTKAKVLEIGKAIHADASRNGHQSDVFVGSTLISMYGKCGSIIDAQSVFDQLSHRNVVSWNAMLVAYNQQGQPEEALRLYEKMSKEGVNADVRTFVAAIQACGMLAEKEGQVEALEMGKTIHRDICSKELWSDVFVGNTLIGMYGKCGSIVDAKKVFDGLQQRNEVSWNIILAAYVQQGQADMALELYTQMQEEGFIPDDRTFVSMVQACGMLAEVDSIDLDGASICSRFLHRGKLIHAYAQSKGYDSDVFVSNSLVSMYGKCGSILDAQSVFDALSHQTVIAWTAILAAYAQQGQAEKALQLYEEMHGAGVSTNDRTFVTVLQACGMLTESEDDVVVDRQATKVESLVTGKVLHAEARRKGYDIDIFVGNTLVSVYGKCGAIVDARIVFDGLLQQNVVSWNGILAAYALQGLAEEAVKVYGEMLEEGVSPNDRTFVSALQACGMLAEKEEDVFVSGQPSKANSLSKVKAIHMAAWRKGYKTDVFIGSTLISMYGKCGSMEDSMHVFDGLSHHSLVSWNAMLSAYVDQHEGDKALQLYRQMQERSRTANKVTLLNVLQACSSTGSLDVCRQIHQTLVYTGSDMTPLLVNALIHAYGRCSSMEDAQRVFDTLLQPDVVSWTALIAGYARQGNYLASLKCYDEMLLSGVKPNGVTFLSILSACSHAGLVGEGVEYFETMSRDYGISPEIEHYVSMVDLLGRAGFFYRVEQLMSTMPMQPNLLMCLCLLGACQKHGEVELGKQVFDYAISQQPKDAAAYVLMLNIYIEAGLWDHAKEVKELRQKAGALKKPGQSWIELEQKVHTFLVGDNDYAPHEHLSNLLSKVCLELEGAQGADAKYVC